MVQQIRAQQHVRLKVMPKIRDYITPSMALLMVIISKNINFLLTSSFSCK